MNNKIAEFKNKIKGKKAAVMGIGVSNTPLIKYLMMHGASVTAFDKKTKEELGEIYDELEIIGCNFSLGNEYLTKLNGFDMIFRTPGMRYDIPELIKAKQDGAEITSEMELFFELCPCEIFGVTGSDGKTTTTTLIYMLLKDAGHKCWLGGNIGAPLLDKVEQIRETDKVVVELSSFQLHTFKQSPHVSVITNISPNHLDVHKSMEEYIDAKKNIFIFQNKEDKLIINYDNEITKKFNKEAKGDHKYFSRVNDIQEGILLKDDWIVNRANGVDTQLIKTSDILLPGNHNVENYMAAIGATLDYINIENIKNVATTFKGVEHRIELVRELNGVKFYNSSIDSSPSRTIAALSTFKQKVILIAGGKDKNIPYDDMGKTLVEKVKCLILIGATADKIEKALKDEIERTGKGTDIKVIRCSTYNEVVNQAYAAAVPGDIVILSPASTSFDMFKNFEERGNTFKQIVNSLE